LSGSGPLVALIEDEPQMRRFLRAALAPRGYRLLEASTAAEGELAVASHNPELVLLDLGLPDRDGIELARRLRTFTLAPILVLSARGREADKVEALDAGADDYLTKPFGVPELLARMRVALRHAARGAGEPEAPVLELGTLRIDFARREVALAGRELRLTPIEWKLLALLARNAGQVVTHRRILREVWGPAYREESNYLHVYVSHLRRKIEPDPARPRYIHNQPGVGYRLVNPAERS